jgi:hypothetical protein
MGTSRNDMALNTSMFTLQLLGRGCSSRLGTLLCYFLISARPGLEECWSRGVSGAAARAIFPFMMLPHEEKG